ncbi:keratin, ultra high-sulfur matrix protein-like [Drosophila montana]|uniref:keratin, ultra high-sulfur matrix protein-like n=1 Tax=Drosophila montana TaxID=40370 RepID=UPI00313CBAED
MAVDHCSSVCRGARTCSACAGRQVWLLYQTSDAHIARPLPVPPGRYAAAATATCQAAAHLGAALAVASELTPFGVDCCCCCSCSSINGGPDGQGCPCTGTSCICSSSGGPGSICCCIVGHLSTWRSTMSPGISSGNCSEFAINIFCRRPGSGSGCSCCCIVGQALLLCRRKESGPGSVSGCTDG